MTVKKSLENAKKAFYASVKLTSEQKYQALVRFAELIWEKRDFLLKENEKDLKAQKATYPALLGLEKAKQEADRLTAAARKALKPFGKKAAALEAISDYLLQREN